VKVAFPTDQASQLPHKFKLTNDDGSFSKTVTLAADCQPGDTDGTSVLTIEDLSEGHTYTLQCDDGTSTYALFENVPYDQLMNNQLTTSQDTGDNPVPPAAPSDPAPGSAPPDSGDGEGAAADVQGADDGTGADPQPASGGTTQ
jgi:hypothetical protein